MKQPLVPIALLYSAGIVLGHFLEAPLLAVWLVTVVISLFALSLGVTRAWLLAAALLLLGWLNMSSRTAVVSPNDLRLLLANESKLVSVRGTIIDAPSQRIFTASGIEKFHTISELELSAMRIGSADWQPAFGSIRVTHDWGSAR